MRLISSAAAGMVLLLALIIGARLHAFVALLLASLFIGLLAGMPLPVLLASVTQGMGSTLGTIAVLVGLGAMFGQMLQSSGGAEVLARTLLARFGERRAPWALAFTGFLVAIPVFFDVALVLLIPIVYSLTERTKRGAIFYAMPLLVGLAATHAFIPPTPGPIAVAVLLKADLGWVILFGTLAGLPAAIIAGPLLGRVLEHRVRVGIPAYMAKAETPPEPLPGTGLVAFLMAVPLVLILVNTVSQAALPPGSAREVLGFVGDPMVALLVTTLLCFWLLGTRRGLSRDEIQQLANRALEPAGIIILVTGAGGVLKQVLLDSGVGDVLGRALQASALPPLVLAFAIAAAVRLMQGSSTVAMMTAAGLVSAMLPEPRPSQQMLALMVIAIAAGATTGSHVNDSGFWLVNRYLGLTVPQTLRTWTVATTLIAFVGLGVVLLLGLIVG